MRCPVDLVEGAAWERQRDRSPRKTGNTGALPTSVWEQRPWPGGCRHKRAALRDIGVWTERRKNETCGWIYSQAGRSMPLASASSVLSGLFPHSRWHSWCWRGFPPSPCGHGDRLLTTRAGATARQPLPTLMSLLLCCPGAARPQPPLRPSSGPLFPPGLIPPRTPKPGFPSSPVPHPPIRVGELVGLWGRY